LGTLALCVCVCVCVVIFIFLHDVVCTRRKMQKIKTAKVLEMARTKKKGRGGKKSKVNFSSLLFSSHLICGEIRTWCVARFGVGFRRLFSCGNRSPNVVQYFLCACDVFPFTCCVVLRLFFSCLGFMV
jgi:hypothetical protein